MFSLRDVMIYNRILMMICALLAVFSSQFPPFLTAKEEKKRERAQRVVSPQLFARVLKGTNQTRKARKETKRACSGRFCVLWRFLLFDCFAKKCQKTLNVVFFHKKTIKRKKKSTFTLEHHGGEKSDCFCEDDDDDIITVIIDEDDDEEHRYHRRIVKSVFFFLCLWANNAAALAQQSQQS